ncbi:MAG: deoxyguanosinetriphosphate triphosphohydrolase [Thermodesulfobacteriota bacterium]
MILYRKDVEARERHELAPYAALAERSRRLKDEPECDLRSAFQRDRDRIVHSKAFRRLKHKTQVFLAPTGDHYRTRLTHTLEVSQIARTLARALRLNEDLTEAICLGHDLGHTPFGHAGEEVLNQIMPGGFSHQEQSLRVVDVLEKEGQGLNLTIEVRDGIFKHAKGKGDIIPAGGEAKALTVEGQIVRVSDIIAYIAHDVDDALRGGVIQEKDISLECVKILGNRTSTRINTMVRDLLSHTRLEDDRIDLAFSPQVSQAMIELREFLYASVYDVDYVHADFVRSAKVIRELYLIFLSDDDLYLKEIGPVPREMADRSRSVCDFVAGMTDVYALDLYNRVFLPRPWGVY